MFRDVSALVAHNPPGLHYGVAVADLGEEGKVFRRDRALFLRDLFIEKMLPERGLVTAGAHHRRGWC